MKPPITNEYSQLAYRLKKQMDDIIDVAYAGDPKLPAFHRFRVQCEPTDTDTFLGKCHYGRRGEPSKVRIMSIGGQEWKDTLVVAIHEVTHHIDVQIRGKSGHDKAFYNIHKKLLFAAFDMGILKCTDVSENTTSYARNREKVARMMKDYVPHPVAYKQDKVSVHVYNCFSVKDTLKAHGYSWNAADKSWDKELDSANTESEKKHLLDLGLTEKDIVIVDGNAVISRLRKSVRLYGVPYSLRDIPKKHGFSWVNTGKNQYWEKKIFDGEFTAEEREQIECGIETVKISIW